MQAILKSQNQLLSSATSVQNQPQTVRELMGCSSVPVKLYFGVLTFEWHRTIMCHNIFFFRFFFPSFKNIKSLLSFVGCAETDSRLGLAAGLAYSCLTFGQKAVSAPSVHSNNTDKSKLENQEVFQMERISAQVGEPRW